MASLPSLILPGPPSLPPLTHPPCPPPPPPSSLPLLLSLTHPPWPSFSPSPSSPSSPYGAGDSATLRNFLLDFCAGRCLICSEMSARGARVARLRGLFSFTFAGFGVGAGFWRGP